MLNFNVQIGLVKTKTVILLEAEHVAKAATPTTGILDIFTARVPAFATTGPATLL